MRQNNHPNKRFSQQAHFVLIPHYTTVQKLWNITDKCRLHN